METPYQPKGTHSAGTFAGQALPGQQQPAAGQSLARIGVWALRLPSGQISWSEEACRIIGFDCRNDPAADTMNYLSAVHPDDRRTVNDAFERARKQHIAPDLAHRIIRPDGAVRHVHLQGQLLRDEAGTAMLSGTVQDVTECRQPAATLQALSEQLVDTVENMTDAFYMLDKEWRFTYLNKEAERLVQRPRAELLGKVIWQEFPDLIGTPFEEQFRQAVNRNQAASFEEVYIPYNSWKELRIFPSREGLAVYFTDISERRHLQEMQRQSEERFMIVAKATTDIIWDWDIRSNRIWWNEGLQNVFGYARDDFNQGIQSWIRRIHPDEKDRVVRSIYGAMEGPREEWSEEYRFMRKNGSHAMVRDHGFFIRDRGGRALRMIGSMVDITERKQEERAREEAEKRNRMQASLLDKAQDAISVYGVDARISYWNKGAERLFGWTAEEAIGKTKMDLLIDNVDEFRNAHQAVLAQGDWSGELRKRRKDGSIFTTESRLTLVRDDDESPQAVLEIETDITQRKEAEREIETLAFFDPLTRLPNRRLLLDRLQHALATSRRTRHKGALLFIDLDNFKSLNDTLGHDKGDMLLQQVARRLEACVARKSDTIARLGGDEFVLMLEDLSEDPVEAASQAESIGEKMLDAFKLPFPLDGHAHHTTTSVGVALFDDRIANIDEMLKQADLAMYQAKAAGRNTIRFFDPGMQTVVTARVELESDLRLGLQQQQFILYYQRQADSNGDPIGAEALLRWRHPRRGLVLPGLFIPLAEETGLILHLGLWVLETACRQLAIWSAKADMSHLTVAVNVSARQFRHPDFVDQVLKVLARTGADPRKLKLELTESLLVANVENVAVKMAALKSEGVGFSLDDFGTGYSSLAYLKRLPLDQLKIDQSFVRDVLTDPNDAAIACTIVSLGQTLGLDVIAEGVETRDQCDFLAKNGCHAYQGYLFSPPVPVEQF